MSTNNSNDNILQVKDPGTMGNELLSVPGFVNELKNYTLAVSPRRFAAASDGAAES